MDKETQTLLDNIAEQAATNVVAKMREFHKDDLRVLTERMDLGFEQMDREIKEIKTDIVEIKTDIVEIKINIVGMNNRFERVEDAFSIFLKEFRADKEKVQLLETQVAELMKRVAQLEAQVA